MVEELGQKEAPAAKAAKKVVDWEAVRADYEEGIIPLQTIQKHYDITAAQLRYRTERDGWTRRVNRHRVNRDKLIERMLKVLDQLIGQLEAKMQTLKDGTSATPDKDTTLLSNMAKTMEKLLQLDAERKGRTEPAEKVNIEDLRERLAERLEQLARRKQI